MGTGNRPNLVSRQRLDLLDVERLRDSIYNDRELVDAGLMGPCEGVLSTCEIAFEDVDVTTKLLRFGEMVLCGYKNLGAARDLSSGFVVPFIPTAPQQNQTTVNIATYEGGSGGVLWWRAGLIPSDLGNRRQWQPGFPIGRAVAINTMLRSRVYFGVSASFASPPAGGETWYRLGRFVYPEGGPPVVTLCHAYDVGFADSPTIARAKFLGQSMLDNRASGSNDGRSYGIARALTVLSNVIMAIKDRDHSWDLETMEITVAGAEDLLARTYRGLKQLDDDLTALDATVTIGHGERLNVLEDASESLGNRVTVLEDAATVRTRIAWAAEIAFDGTITKQMGDILGNTTVSVVRSPTGTYTITFSLAVNPAIAIVMERPTTLDQYGRKTVTWTSSVELVVSFFNASGADANCAFTIIVTN
jgi:hypothetical protein